MKRCRKRTIRRELPARTPVFALSVLVILALTAVLASGCGEGGASPPASLYIAHTPPVATTSNIQTRGSLSLPGTDAAATDSTSASTSTSTSASAPTTTAAKVASAKPSASTSTSVLRPTTTAAKVTTTKPSVTTTLAPTTTSTTTTSTTTTSTTTTSTPPPTEPKGPTSLVLTDGQTPLKGVWSGTADRLASYLLGICPSPSFTVSTPVLAGYYMRYCAQAGLRADLLWAQMIHETGYGTYGGDVLPEQNNYAGIGATGGGNPGFSFPTAEAGVMAHVAHMVAYVYVDSPVSWANSATDPRFNLVDPRGIVSVLADLNGRWAVPGTTYGQKIETIARRINGG